MGNTASPSRSLPTRSLNADDPLLSRSSYRSSCSGAEPNDALTTVRPPEVFAVTAVGTSVVPRNRPVSTTSSGVIEVSSIGSSKVTENVGPVATTSPPCTVDAMILGATVSTLNEEVNAGSGAPPMLWRALAASEIECMPCVSGEGTVNDSVLPSTTVIAVLGTPLTRRSLAATVGRSTSSVNVTATAVGDTFNTLPAAGEVAATPNEPEPYGAVEPVTEREYSPRPDADVTRTR